MLLHTIPVFLFWVSCGLLFYTFAGYGLLISALARLRPKPVVPSAPDTPQPSVCIVLVACNEEKRIADRLRNLLAAQYPADQLRVLLVSDGSTDATVAQARSLQDARIEIIEQPTRSGKAAGLNLGVSHRTADILVFTDARQRFAEDAIARLVAHFADPAIGAVSGSLEIAPAASATGAGVDAYWRYEKSLRAAESQWDSCVGCTGAIYALRRDLFMPIPEDTLLDDVVIPMQAAAQGARVIHDPAAVAFDPQSLEPEAEQRRKQRTLAGGFQMLFRYPAWLLPKGHRLWWQLISHKYLRLLAPFFLIGAFVANIPLAGEQLYAPFLAAQILLYFFAVLSRSPAASQWKFCKLPAGFVFLNFQVLRGLRYYLVGGGRQGWQ
ncbi:glycosyl transferase family 2 [Chthoniobacter flavus Ellin428]|uniref:Glycosyl transferase family 2 n=1 Tax=Chthoniobacter flavus Ellin428 TaxID=497964 RepID=B4CZV3_9BACT|nr:glycosyltransferase family 2 protein [Chthoniobacter flavus]EDY20267.1 glycosyl transferase family 2 [Chthoniobacter flavus Ellin428]TCO94164.1 cellulose synthase/poly-beta-1,6-N-acetylglucosamine synthase-like glycosyltransferase [Chthoniobacter flavus]